MPGTCVLPVDTFCSISNLHGAHASQQARVPFEGAFKNLVCGCLTPQNSQWDAMFDSSDSTPHPAGQCHDPSDETIVACFLRRVSRSLWHHMLCSSSSSSSLSLSLCVCVFWHRLTLGNMTTVGCASISIFVAVFAVVCHNSMEPQENPSSSANFQSQMMIQM